MVGRTWPWRRGLHRFSVLLYNSVGHPNACQLLPERPQGGHQRPRLASCCGSRVVVAGSRGSQADGRVCRRNGAVGAAMGTRLWGVLWAVLTPRLSSGWVWVSTSCARNHFSGFGGDGQVFHW